MSHSAKQESEFKNPQEDEIDLIELFLVLWSHKLWIFVITLLSVLFASVYLYVAKPVYQTQVYFSPPSLSDFTELNQLNLLFLNNSSSNYLLKTGATTQFNSSSVFGKFTANLQSIKLYQEFIKQPKIQPILLKEYGIVPSDDFKEKKLLSSFSSHLNFKCDKKTKAFINKSIRCLSFEFSNNILVAQFLNSFIGFIAKRTVNDLVNLSETEIRSKISKTEKIIASMKLIARQNKANRIALLRENLAIAKKLKLKESNIRNAANRLNMEYTRGSIAISKEIKILRNRKNQDAFIKGLAQLKQNLVALKAIHLAKNKISAFTLELKALVPERPIKPKKLLILIISLFIGLLIAIFIVFSKNAIVNYKSNSKK